MHLSAPAFLRPFAPALAALLLLTGCGPSEPAEPPAKAFVERIQPADFFAAELAFEQPYSRTHDVVFLRTDFGKPVSALALHREPSGDHTLVFATPPLAGSAEWNVLTTPLDRTVGEQVARAVELKLHLGVMLAGTRKSTTKNDGDLWVFLRLPGNKVVSALIAFDATVGVPAATEFVDGLIGSLQQLVGAQEPRRTELLTQIDRLATEMILRATPK